MHREVVSSYPSIIKTFNHIWATEEYWYSIIGETNTFEPRQEATEINTQEILSGGLNRANLLADLIRSYSGTDLSKTVKIENPWFQCELPKYEYLIQAVNHGTYHRGQIITIARNLGITDASNTDYNFYNVVKQSAEK